MKYDREYLRIILRQKIWPFPEKQGIYGKSHYSQEIENNECMAKLSKFTDLELVSFSLVATENYCTTC